MAAAVLDEIDVLIRARYPVLYVVSSEEQRVIEWLVAAARRRGKQVLEWSCSTGLVPAGTSLQSQRARSSASRDPLVALDLVIDQVEPSLFVFKDLHPFLTRGGHAVVRRLKETAHELRDSYKTIVLVSPALELPPELEKEVTVIDFPLPGPAEIGALLERIASEVAGRKELAVDRTPQARARLVTAALGLTLTEAENVFAKLIVRGGSLGEGEVATVLAEKRQIVRKSGLLDYYESEARMDLVGGLDLLKAWLAKRAAALGPEARAFGLPPPRGVLLLGVQGCGKSLSAKAVAAMWRIPLLRLDVGRLFGSLVGSSEENMRRAIQVAESIAPVVLWVDEIDKALAGSRASGSTDSGTGARVLGTFLTWLAEKRSGVFVIATANDIASLPPELLRKGRFDEIFFVDLPNPRERREVFSIHLRKRRRDPSAFDLDRLVVLSEGFSGAEIEQAIVSALFETFGQGRDIGSDDVARALQETVPLSTTMEEKITELREWAKHRTKPASRGE